MANSGARTFDFHRGQPYRATLISAAKKALQRGRLGGLIVMLGAMESGSQTAADEMYANGKTLINTRRQDINVPDLPVFWSLLALEKIVPRHVLPVRRLAQDLSDVMVINYDREIHYNLEEYLEWANEAVATISRHDRFRKPIFYKLNGTARRHVGLNMAVTPN